jgi:sterol desaturase/sphingolipid hydroxylase (fatty acid hydroxylase superfamily)
MLVRLAEASWGLVPFAVLFGALALVTKRGALGADLRRGAPDIGVTFGFFVVDAIVVAPFAALLATAPAAALHFDSPLAPLWRAAPSWLVVMLVLVAGDYVGYWRHRLSHTRWLWPIHEAHHSDRALNWFSLLRTHPLERLYTAFVDSLVLALCGFPLWALVANNVVRSAWGFFIHADLRWTLGAAGAALISPSAHRWHHARDERLAGANFATLFTVWDRLHGTWRASEAPCTVDTGVEGIPTGFMATMLRPFALYGRALLARCRVGTRPAALPQDR